MSDIEHLPPHDAHLPDFLFVDKCYESAKKALEQGDLAVVKEKIAELVRDLVITMHSELSTEEKESSLNVLKNTYFLCSSVLSDAEKAKVEKIIDTASFALYTNQTSVSEEIMQASKLYWHILYQKGFHFPESLPPRIFEETRMQGGWVLSNSISGEENE